MACRLLSVRSIHPRINNAFPHSGIDHRLDRKNHARSYGNMASVPMMRDFGRFMECDSDPMANELVHDGTAVGSA